MWSARAIMWSGGGSCDQGEDHVTRGGSCDQLERSCDQGVGSCDQKSSIICWPCRGCWCQSGNCAYTVQQGEGEGSTVRDKNGSIVAWSICIKRARVQGVCVCVCVCVWGGGGGCGVGVWVGCTLTWLSSFWYCGTLRIYRPRSLIDTCVCAYTWHHTLAQVLRRENLGTRLITLVVLAYICVSILLRFRL